MPGVVQRVTEGVQRVTEGVQRVPNGVRELHKLPFLLGDVTHSQLIP
jgi:hypothetical protein